MSYYDGFVPTYKFSLCIDRGDRILVDTTVEVKATAEEISKAKRTINRLMSEYAPAATPMPIPQESEPPKQNPEAQAPNGTVDPLEPEGVAPPEKKQEGVRGLLRLRCPECRNTFGTFLREHQSEIVCKCGHHIDLTVPLAGYRFTCPYCEKETWGQTNLEDPEITIRCKCGGDVELRWVPKVKEYRN